jgi:hypothetical protein
MSGPAGSISNATENPSWIDKIRWESSATQSVIFCAVFVAVAVAIARVPPPGLTAAAGLAGYPRLALLALAGVILGLTAIPSQPPSTSELTNPAFSHDDGAPLQVESADEPILLAFGLVVVFLMSAWNVLCLRSQVEDWLGHAIWLGSMALLLLISFFPAAFKPRLPRWPQTVAAEPVRSVGLRHWLPWAILFLLLGVAVAARFPNLGNLPIGIQADEGDRANWALRVLAGLAPVSWFADGWYLINMVYFRLLASFMSIFGTSVAGTRTMSAIAGTLFVMVVAWVGCRAFNWRTGLLAAALATTGALYVQQSRFIGESGITALLWAVSVAGFLEGGRSGRAWAFALAGLAGGMSLYFYPSGRLWVVGAACSVILLIVTRPPAGRRAMVQGGIVAAVAALIAVAPFLVHLEQHPNELTTRYNETAILRAENQPRVSYLNPPVSLPELLALQLERTVGMFDRYEDGVSFLPTARPALPQPLGAITIAGIVYVAVRGLRDRRFAIMAVWYALGVTGVFLTVESPDFLRASGALVTFPFFAALPMVDVADRIGRLARRSTIFRVRLTEALARNLSPILVGSVAAVAMVGQAYLYFVVYPPLMAPSWSYATQEGLQINRLGQTGPVVGIEMFAFHIDAGWVHFLAQGVTLDEAPNPGSQLPVLYAESVGADDAAVSLHARPNQSLSFLLYPDPNQTAFAGFLAGLYPDGRLEAPIAGRMAFVVPPAAIEAGLGASVKVGGEALSRHVPTLGSLPAGFTGPSSLVWEAGIRLPRSGRYQFRVASSRPATLEIDGIAVARSDGTSPVALEIVGAQGTHFIRLGAKDVTSSDRITVERTGEAGSVDGSAYHQISQAELYSRADGNWGLLGHVIRGTDNPRVAANVSETFVDSGIAAIDLQSYVPNYAPGATVVWEGNLIAPTAGAYRFGMTSDGTTSLSIDGHAVTTSAVKWEEWKDDYPGTSLRLAAGAHPLKVTFTATGGGRSVIRLNWVPPRPDGSLDGGRSWSVVPPNVLRAPPAVWVP